MLRFIAKVFNRNLTAMEIEDGLSQRARLRRCFDRFWRPVFSKMMRLRSVIARERNVSALMSAQQETRAITGIIECERVIDE